MGIVRMEMPMATRRVLFDPTDPASLPPDQRRREIATILAAGVIRMRVRSRHGIFEPPPGHMHVADFAGIR